MLYHCNTNIQTSVLLAVTCTTRKHNSESDSNFFQFSYTDMPFITVQKPEMPENPEKLYFPTLLYIKHVIKKFKKIRKPEK